MYIKKDFLPLFLRRVDHFFSIGPNLNPTEYFMERTLVLVSYTKYRRFDIRQTFCLTWTTYSVVFRHYYRRERERAMDIKGREEIETDGKEYNKAKVS